MRRRRRKEVDFRLEIAPVNLIDLLLVILIFFITTTTFLQLRLIELGLPESGADALQKSDKKTHVVNIERNCTLFLDAKAVDPAALKMQVGTIRDAEKDALFHIGADAESPHRCFVDVLDTLNAAGIENIGILTAPET